jgi:hypothetical protein
MEAPRRRYGQGMTRGMLWTAAFALVGIFAVVGAVFDDPGQRTWAVVSTLGIIGVIVLGGIYGVFSGVQRLGARLERLKPRAFRRR